MTSLSSISNNTLTVVIHSPAVSFRYISSLVIGNNLCAFPESGDLLFTKGFDTLTCEDSFTASIIVQDLGVFCGFSTFSDSDHTYLTGSISVSAVDVLPAFRSISITRTTSASISIELVLPRNLTLTSENITVISPIDTLAAVTDQSYDSSTDTATIQISTSVQWPYYLLVPTAQPPNGLFNISITLLDSTLCPNNIDADCFQVWQVQIGNIAGSDQCNLDGNYTFDWEYNCQPSFTALSDCPIVGGSNISSIVASLASDDVCTTLNVVANIGGSIAAYSDADFATEQLIFPSNERVYLEAKITADVSFLIVDLVTVTVVQNGVPLIIYTNGSEVNSALSFNHTPTATGVQFSFVAVDAEVPSFFVFDSSTGADVYSFDIQVELVVIYSTVLQRRKRDTESSVVALKASLILDASQHQSSRTLPLTATSTAATPYSVSPVAILVTAAALGGLAALV